ncbi:hypothetical protein OF83DRAFT_821420 [Amylostereum chailletii]|nr:hypothetical protein OF83DRAFT_821420 [Amylostereum chailletii]
MRMRMRYDVGGDREAACEGDKGEKAKKAQGHSVGGNSWMCATGGPVRERSRKGAGAEVGTGDEKRKRWKGVLRVGMKRKNGRLKGGGDYSGLREEASSSVCRRTTGYISIYTERRVGEMRMRMRYDVGGDREAACEGDKGEKAKKAQEHSVGGNSWMCATGGPVRERSRKGAGAEVGTGDEKRKRWKGVLRVGMKREWGTKVCARKRVDCGRAQRRLDPKRWRPVGG